MLTQERLKEILDYNPETGELTWLIQAGPARPRMVAGNIDPKGYRKIKIRRINYLAHRIIWLWMTGEWPSKDLDHIDTVKDNNRWINLRECTNSENHCNTPKSAANKSGVKGVHWNRESRKWHAQIKSKGIVKYLGLFTELSEAAHAVATERALIHQNFAHNG
jgi:hypothetical protein